MCTWESIALEEQTPQFWSHTYYLDLNSSPGPLSIAFPIH